jgi:quercetin dioxygenase-like cupin family protein
MNSLERQDHSFDAPVRIFDLGATVELLKNEERSHSGSRNAVTLVKTPSIKVVLIRLERGSSLPEHHAEGTIGLLVFSGAVDFTVAGETTHLTGGSYVALGEGISHTLHAQEESVVLLTVIPKQRA